MCACSWLLTLSLLFFQKLHEPSSIHGDNNSNRILTPISYQPCILTLVSVDEGQELEGGKRDTFWSCELQGEDALKAGYSFVTVEGLGDQFFADNNVESGLTTLSAEGAVFSGTEMIVPAEVTPSLGVDGRRLSERHSRNLAVTGVRKVLVVRVNARDRSTTGSEEWLAQKVFTDGTTLASQYAACSHSKLNFIPASGRGISSSGTMTVNINAKVVGASPESIVDLVEAEVRAKVGIDSSTSLSTLFQHMMVCLPKGTNYKGNTEW